MARPRTHEVCSFEGCTKKHNQHGLCCGHWAQIRAGKELRPLRYKAPDGEPVWRAPRAEKRPVLVQAAKPDKKMPASWERTSEKKPKRRRQANSGFDEVPMVQPLPVELQQAVARLLSRHAADDLAEVLGI